MRTGYKVGDVMTQNPKIASPIDTLRHVANLMKRHRVGSILLVQGDTLAGIVTENDMVRKAMCMGMDVDKTIVSSIMTPAAKMVTVKPIMDIFDALTRMSEYGVRHMPVVEGKTLVGLITLKDILRIQPQLFDIIAENSKMHEVQMNL